MLTKGRHNQKIRVVDKFGQRWFINDCAGAVTSVVLKLPGSRHWTVRSHYMNAIRKHL